MAPSLNLLFPFLLIAFAFISPNQALTSSNPKALLLPITKDSATLQYVTNIKIGTPSVGKKFVMDLGGRQLWLDCDKGYISSTYRPSRCGSAACSFAKSRICIDICLPHHWPGCNNHTCDLWLENTSTKTSAIGEVSLDNIVISATDGSKSGSPVSIPNFIFNCGYSWLLAGLAHGVTGMVGLGRTTVGLPSQLSSVFGGNFHSKFAICLPATPQSMGVLFLGETPYVFHASSNKSRTVDVSSRFTFTRLFKNPVSTSSDLTKGETSADYFVGVKSILVDRTPIPINSTLLSFDKKGIGGTKISTVNPYTVLESSIYNALVKVFDEQLMKTTFKIKKVAGVKPFADCYSTENLHMTQVGFGVPDITLEFENKDVTWTIFGANSMVEISRDVVCLGFLNGGSNPRTSIVIGAHQLQDNLLQFDIAGSKLGFTSSLIVAEIECSNFNF